MGETYDEKRTIKIDNNGTEYCVFDWNGIFEYTVGEDRIYYVDPTYIDKFLKQGY